MADTPVKLTRIKVALDNLLLDPSNPRFARSLNLPPSLPDSEVAAVQRKLRDLFVIKERASEADLDEDDLESGAGAVEIGDLVRQMDEIGFVAIDRIVVRKLTVNSKTEQYVVIEGNRRVSAAKHLYDRKPGADPDAKTHHEWVANTVKELEVLLLDTEGLDAEVVHHQIGVILGLRHFGSVLGWGPLAKAVNIYNEYRATEPPQQSFALDNRRLSSVETRLSVPRSGVKSALSTYIAYQQLQAAFPQGPPRPSHYSLIQACVMNRKMITSGFIDQDKNTFELSAASVENLNTVCEFQTRDDMTEEQKILTEPKSVSALAGLIGDAASNKDDAVRAFAASLRDQVLNKERSLSDAVDNLRSFKTDRAWTEALQALLAKVAEPGMAPANAPPDEKRLKLKDFQPKGNELLKLEEAQKAFRNVRKILDV